MPEYNTDVDVLRLTVGIAGALGPQWRGAPHPTREKGAAILHGPAAERFFLSVGTWKKSDDGMLNVHGSIPDDLAKSSTDGDEWGSIRVGHRRGPEAIARAIERRLLPQYHETLEAARLRKRRADDTTRQVEATIAGILDALDGTGSRAGGYAPNTLDIERVGDAGVRGSVRVTSGDAEFEITVPAVYAAQFARLVVSLSRRIADEARDG